MSEDFDREAEREKLRQQLEAEESSRRSTEHLSELLLKGATMTNRHCEECGDPIFRYEGRSFCPTCQREVGGNGQTAADAETAAEPAPDDARAATEETPTEQGSHQRTAPPSEPAESVDRADLDAARAALGRKLTALATEAENTTDVRRARSLLEATREAAEALRAVGELD